MTRRYTTTELRLHRDNVYEMVCSGKLPGNVPLTQEDIHGIAASLAHAAQNSQTVEERLSEISMEILVAASYEAANVIIGSAVDGTAMVRVGYQEFFIKQSIGQSYPEVISPLLERKFLYKTKSGLALSSKAKKYLDELSISRSTYFVKKAKCLACSLHFVICTFNEDTHNASNLFCPECGQHEGRFLVWVQKQPGFIFQQVPGRARLYDHGFGRMS